MLNGYRITRRTYEDQNFIPFSSEILVSHNHIKKSGFSPTAGSSPGSLELLQELQNIFQENVFADVIYDGDYPSSDPRDAKICFSDNTEFTFRNLNYSSHFNHLRPDVSPLKCKLERLSPVQIEDW